MMSACRIILILSLVSLLLPALLAKSQQARRRRGTGAGDVDPSCEEGERCPKKGTNAETDGAGRRRRNAVADDCDDPTGKTCKSDRKRRETVKDDEEVCEYEVGEKPCE